MAKTDFQVDLIEKELIEVKLYSVDFLRGKENIEELGDTNIIKPKNGEILIYKDGYWVNLPVDAIFFKEYGLFD